MKKLFLIAFTALVSMSVMAQAKDSLSLFTTTIHIGYIPDTVKVWALYTEGGNVVADTAAIIEEETLFGPYSKTIWITANGYCSPVHIRKKIMLSNGREIKENEVLQINNIPR